MRGWARWWRLGWFRHSTSIRRERPPSSRAGCGSVFCPCAHRNADRPGEFPPSATPYILPHLPRLSTGRVMWQSATPGCVNHPWAPTSTMTPRPTVLGPSRISTFRPDATLDQNSRAIGRITAIASSPGRIALGSIAVIGGAPREHPPMSPEGPIRHGRFTLSRGSNQVVAIPSDAGE